MNWAGVLFIGFMLGVLSACGLVSWWCILPPRDSSADDFEINQQLDREGRDGDDADEI